LTGNRLFIYDRLTFDILLSRRHLNLSGILCRNPAGSARDIGFHTARKHFYRNLRKPGRKHIELGRGRAGHIDYPVMDKRPAVINADRNPSVIRKIGNNEHGPKRKFGMCCRKFVGIKYFPRSRRPAFKFGAVKRSGSFLPETGHFQLALGKNCRIGR
jgi:hypothetical protein